MQARSLPAERAVLAVLRDRTEEMRREFAEADFVSNAAHELRNPLAGISGAIEVLQAGAKDDPEARDHFLARLAEDADRMSRLTKALLTLARVESIGVGEMEVVDVPAAVRDAIEAVEPPVGIKIRADESSRTSPPRATRPCCARCWSDCSPTPVSTLRPPAPLRYAPAAMARAT